MNVVEINLTVYGSSNAIVEGVSEGLKKEGHRVLKCYPATRANLRKSVDDSYVMRTRIERNLGIILSKWFGGDGLWFRVPTKRLIRRIDRFNVDLVHLHLLQGQYINFPMLFRYLQKKKIPAVWTLHDAWALTGDCGCFDMIGCEKWKADCSKCPLSVTGSKKRGSPARMLRIKRKFITGTPNLTLAAPSEWMASIAGQSYLKNSSIVVVNNGIDTDVFCPTESDFRSRWQLEGKTILLGVALPWREGKGSDVFIRLANELDDRFCIVMVGTDENIDKTLPDNIVSIHRTFDRTELATIYSAADLFVNPTLQENFPTVNIEALACGTPVLTYNTGGSPETIDQTCGCVVDKGDYDSLKAEILRITRDRPFSSEDCRKRAMQLSFTNMQEAYIDLFKDCIAKARS